MARRVSRKGTRFVAGWEGFRSCPYRDAVGVWTIGYGETQNVGPNTPCISKRKARRQLRQRLNRDYAAPVRRNTKPRLRRRELDALASFAYNNGVGSFLGSTLRERLNSREGRSYRRRKAIYREELPKWVYAGGEKLLGLVKRRAAEVQIAVNGDYSGRP